MPATPARGARADQGWPRRRKILEAIDGCTPAARPPAREGIQQAYRLAEQNFDQDGVNRVILATDGDFNVGITDIDELKGFVEGKRETASSSRCSASARGNYNDALMQALAQNGNGNAAYIDTLNEARKVLVDEVSSTLFPIAKDVKIQVEFNPATVAEYRLIGYETRLLQARGLQQRQGRCRRHRLRPHGDGDLRDHAGREPEVRRGPALSAAGGGTMAVLAKARASMRFLKIHYKLPTETQPPHRAADHAALEKSAIDQVPTEVRFSTRSRLRAAAPRRALSEELRLRRGDCAGRGGKG